MNKLIALMVLATMVLTGCNKDKITNLDEKIIGKWVVADKDGKSAPTNEKMVLTFLSPSKAMVSASLNAHQGTKLWVNQQEADVVINGDKMTLTFHSDAHSTSVHEFTVTSINDNEFVAKQKVAAFGDNMPTKQQLQELIEKCQWTLDDAQNVVTFTGPNGNTLELPRKGKRSTNGNIYYDGSDGEPASACYWSGTAIDATYAWRLDSGGFASGVYMYDGKRGAGASIRLVK